MATPTILAPPQLAVPFADRVPDDRIAEAINAGATIAELRIDTFSTRDETAILAEIGRFAQFPVILATVRSQAEGGDWNATEAERLALYRAVIPRADWIDIELSAREIRKDVLRAAREAPNTPGVIVSFHDFIATPRLEVLQEKFSRARETGADIVKIATMVDTMADLQVLAALMMNNPAVPKIVIGMGAYGSLSRVFFPALGSLVTFAHLGAPTAPGQLTLAETAALLAQFYPEFKGK